MFSEPGVVIHGRTCHCALAASYPSAVFPPPSVLDLQIHVLRAFLSAAPGGSPMLICLDPISSEKWVPAVVRSGNNWPAPKSCARLPLPLSRSQAFFNKRIQVMAMKGSNVNLNSGENNSWPQPELLASHVYFKDIRSTLVVCDGLLWKKLCQHYLWAIQHNQVHIRETAP